MHSFPLNGFSAPTPERVPQDAVFEMLVLGSGGGPLETDCSGYLVKPASGRWEDGILALEGGSGIGALANLLRLHATEDLFPDVDFPQTHNSPVLKAAYIFSFLSCYLITHAHLDHAVSLILLSGSIPCKPNRNSRILLNHDLLNPSEAIPDETAPPVPARIPVYAIQETLDNLAKAYGGGLWPELGAWATAEELMHSGRRKRRRTQELTGVGPKFYPLATDKARKHTHLNAQLPISTLVFPVSHGQTSQGPYSSSAVFIRYDPSLMPSRPASRRASTMSNSQDDGEVESSSFMDSAGREFLFFGDVESEWRADHETEVNKDGGAVAGVYNRAIWEQAAVSLQEGRLAGVFLECSYDSARPATIMFGHLSPPGIMYELKTLASFVGGASRPLEGLKIYITHVKEFLVPHRSGLGAHELIQSELDALEAEAQLGVVFHVISPGDRLLI
ncbi:hypothetical protein CspeluHIS016_0202590 [Cutaneotrichosporon spelunceum]|uniref:Cyclic-AMP phosphodiesterase n=1 Tax=Cutaneotrichosporon spelunceum TaxID=1672016 RepID=A0AAD3TR53_9TREE|nr:hypothetical protein CspeluHIS016_0202590 [Cutaneotrichosporon spelunceum]